MHVYTVTPLPPMIGQVLESRVLKANEDLTDMNLTLFFLTLQTEINITEIDSEKRHVSMSSN
jgi:hypothetical protein